MIIVDNSETETEENHRIEKTLKFTEIYVIAKFQVAKTIQHFIGIILNLKNIVKFII